MSFAKERKKQSEFGCQYFKISDENLFHSYTQIEVKLALLARLACLAGINIGTLLAQACATNECEKLTLRKNEKMKLKKVMVFLS